MKIEDQVGKNKLTLESGVIYLCCSPVGEPIYIGQTVDWAARRRVHSGKPWWPEVSYIDFIPAHDGEARVGAERALIRIFNPKCNVAETTNPPHTCMPESSIGDVMDRLAERRRISHKQMQMDRDGYGPVEIAPFGFVRSRRQTRGKPDAEWWTHRDVAVYLGIHETTSMLYEHSGHLPPPERVIAGRPVWRPAVVMSFREPNSGPIRYQEKYERFPGQAARRHPPA